MKGIRISKSGQNVLTSKKEDLYVDTSTPLYKVAIQDKGTIDFSATETNNTKRITINHNLNYEPLYSVYAERVPSRGILRLCDSLGLTLNNTDSTLSDRISVKSGVTDKQLVVDFTSYPTTPNPAGTYHFYYFIFFNS